MKTLKSQILALTNNIATQKVDGIEVAIFVKKLTVGEFDRLQKLEKDCTDKGELPLAVDFIHFACDEKGEPIFGLDELDDVKNLPTELVSAVVRQGMEFNYPAEKNA